VVKETKNATGIWTSKLLGSSATRIDRSVRVLHTHTHGAKTQANCDRHKLVHLIKLKVGARDIFCSNLTTPFHPCKLGGAETSGVDRIVDKDEVIILGGEEVWAPAGDFHPSEHCKQQAAFPRHTPATNQLSWILHVLYCILQEEVWWKLLGEQ
jgi:hypothetical protein